MRPTHLTVSCGDSLYHELKESHGSFEGAHDWWRDRYKVAADTHAIRPKVRSIRWHRLPANVACLIEWLRICLRVGWLGSARRNHLATERNGQQAGQAIADNFADMRVRMGLTEPYGAKAASVNACRHHAGPGEHHRASGCSTSKSDHSARPRPTPGRQRWRFRDRQQRRDGKCPFAASNPGPHSGVSGP